ncbi:MAG: hypothetical protein OXG02_00570 [Chloroflexi bacterium]|nr:hypothetical protein [Chloroflexota bacterium]
MSGIASQAGRKRVLFRLGFSLVLIGSLLGVIAHRADDLVMPELDVAVFEWLMGMVRNERGGVMFSEEWLVRFPYSRTAYAEYAAGLTVDTPCASWENGGITWWDRRAVSWERAPEYLAAHPELAVGWDAIVHFPAFRFCGFPEPYPEKPLLATPAT